MAKKRIVSEIIKQKIVSLYTKNEDYSINFISSLYGYGYTRVKKILEEKNIKIRPKKLIFINKKHVKSTAKKRVV